MACFTISWISTLGTLQLFVKIIRRAEMHPNETFLLFANKKRRNAPQWCIPESWCVAPEKQNRSEKGNNHQHESHHVAGSCETSSQHLLFDQSKSSEKQPQSKKKHITNHFPFTFFPKNIPIFLAWEVFKQRFFVSIIVPHFPNLHDAFDIFIHRLLNWLGHNLHLIWRQTGLQEVYREIFETWHWWDQMDENK